jgi:hypothetical protein
MDFATFIESQRSRVCSPERRQENASLIAQYGDLFSPANIPHLTAE